MLQPLAALYTSTLADGTYIFLPLALLPNTLLPIVGGVVALTVTDTSWLQLPKAEPLILVIPVPISTVVSLLH